MQIRPLADRVVIKRVEAVETTKSGIVLPGASKEKPQEAEVVAVGPGTNDVKMELAVGDKVLFGKFSGTEVKLEGTEYIIIKQDDILAVIE